MPASSATLETAIAGIPCIVKFTVSGRYQPARIHAPAEFCHEAEYPEVEFDVFTTNGKPAGKWLTDKCTPKETARIEEEILDAMSVPDPY